MKDIENYKGIIDKELSTLKLMNTCYAIHKVFVRNKDLNPAKKH